MMMPQPLLCRELQSRLSFFWAFISTIISAAATFCCSGVNRLLLAAGLFWPCLLSAAVCGEPCCWLLAFEIIMMTMKAPPLISVPENLCLSQR